MIGISNIQNTVLKMSDQFRDDYHVQKKRATKITILRQEDNQLRIADQIAEIESVKGIEKEKNARSTEKWK